MNDHERVGQMREFGQRVADALGPFWKAVTDDHGNYIHLSYMGQEAFSIHPYGYDWKGSDRISISCLFPKFENHPVLSFYGDRKAPHRTCAIRRGPAAIAKDIRRYMWRDWLALKDEAQEIVERYERERDARLKTAEGFAAAVGEQLSERWYDDYNRSERPTIHFNPGSMYATATIGSNDMELKLKGVPFEVGFKIARVIREYYNK